MKSTWNHFFYLQILHIFRVQKLQEKPLFLVGDLNINSLDYFRNTYVCDIFNFVFQNDIFPVINRRTIATNLSDHIDHILANTTIDSHIQSGVFSLIKTNLERTNIKKNIIKGDKNNNSMKYFKSIFKNNDWDL